MRALAVNVSAAFDQEQRVQANQQRGDHKTRADAARALASPSTMVWPFGPSASFNAIVSTKRAQRADAIDSQVVALQADSPLTAEEVAIVGKSGEALVQFMASWAG